MKKLTFLLLINLLTFSVLAADGDLDSSFGTNGMVIETFYDLQSINSSVAVQPDGKIVVAGYTSLLSNGQTDFTIVRYHPNGSLDTGFGTGGKVLTDNNGKLDNVPEILVLPDGKILLVGQSRNAEDRPAIAIYRYHSNGSLDTGFGTNGMILSAFTTSGTRGDTLGDAIVQPDGKIVVTGQWQGTSFCVGRFNANGALDTAFGTRRAAAAGSRCLRYGLDALARAANGRQNPCRRTNSSIIVYTRRSDFIVFRFNANGIADTTFDGDGYAITDFDSSYDEARSVHVLADGKILADRSQPESTPATNIISARRVITRTARSTLRLTATGKRLLFPTTPPVRKIIRPFSWQTAKSSSPHVIADSSPAISTDGQICAV